MIISYFDSSLLLSILFNESHAEEALDVDGNLENSISKYYEALSECKSLDAIHLASALKISEKYNRNQICICSFDNNMRNLAQKLGFKVNYLQNT